MTNVILNEVKNPRNKGRSGCIVVRTPIFVYALPLQRESILPGRVVFFGLYIMDNIKSAGFAFPGDVSLALNMTYFVCVILNAVKNLPEGWYFSEFIRKTKKPECKIFLRSGFNHIVNLFVNYINLLTKFWVYERRKMKNAKRNVIVSSFMAIALCMSIVAGATFELKSEE